MKQKKLLGDIVFRFQQIGKVHGVRFGNLAVEQIAAALKRIAGLGLRLRVSELDVSIPDNSQASLQKQAKKYAAVMRMLSKYTDQLEAVQVWGLTDGMSWIAAKYPLLFDRAGQPKPAFWAVAEPEKYAE